MRDDLTIGESVKNTQLTKYGVDCVDTICQICPNIGAMIFGHLFRIFQKSQNAEKHLDLIKINLGQKKTFIGTKQTDLVKTTNSTCGIGERQLVRLIQIITLIKTYVRNTALILSGTTRNLLSKMVLAPSVKIQRQRRLKDGHCVLPLITRTNLDKQEDCFV